MNRSNDLTPGVKTFSTGSGRRTDASQTLAQAISGGGRLLHRLTGCLVASLVILLSLLPLCEASAQTGANPGDLDVTFGAGGKVLTRLGGIEPGTGAMAVIGGKILVVGGTRVPLVPLVGEPIDAAMLIRYNSDGSVDTSFGPKGIVISRAFQVGDTYPDDYAWRGEAVLVADNKIIVAGRAPLLRGGYTTGPGGFIVARYNMDGGLDPSFARKVDLDPMQPGTRTDNYYEFSAVRPGMLGLTDNVCGEGVKTIARQANGQLLIALSSRCGVLPRSGFVIRLNANGTPDVAYGLGGTAQVGAGAIALQNDQLIVAGGSFISRWNADGRPDQTFGGNLGFDATAVMIQSGGKIVVTGWTAVEASGREGIALARYNGDGSLDTSFGSGGITITDFAADFGPETNARGLAATLQPNGKIIVAGEVGILTGPFLTEKFAIVRYTADGLLDTSFGSGGITVADFTELVPEQHNSTPYAVAIDEAGKIVVAGHIHALEGVDTDGFVALARFLGGNNTPVGSNIVAQNGPATLTFASVTQAGDTTVTVSASGPPPPSGFQLGNPATFYDIETTASYLPPIRVCINYTGIVFSNETGLLLWHFEGGAWADRTIAGSLDTVNNTICALVDSLSPFAVFEPTAINKATPTVTVASATYTYDAQPHPATGVVTGVGGVGLGAPTFTYNGDGAAPVDAGSYAVIGSFAGDDNYAPATGSATLLINRATPVVHVIGGTFIYDALPHAASGVVTGVGGVDLGTPTFTYNGGPGAPVNAGIYNAIGLFAGNANYGPAAGGPALLVINALPVITSLTGPLTPSSVGLSSAIGVTFADLATFDTHTCRFSWGDGQPDTTVGAEVNAGACEANHVYTSAGVYTVVVTIVDDDGLSASNRFQYVVIYDTDGGFVTGGGWIDSPAGAYAAVPTLTGKANFGFVSKYHKGATVPTGQTEFQFKAGSLNFHSSSYEWLVIAGAKAQYKGSGTINGAGDYAFRLTAVDGQINGGGGKDKFRIKIWDKSTGGVVYDNQHGAADTDAPATVIGGGSIVIHSNQ